MAGLLKKRMADRISVSSLGGFLLYIQSSTGIEIRATT
jgi:hypothetical protein